MPISESLRNTKAKFLNCELHCNSGHLFIDDKEINLEPMIFQFLLLLIEQQGQIVPKSEVIAKLWQDKKPTDEALRALVKKTREALGDNARNPVFIKTIPTKGYLLIPMVEIRSTAEQSWVKKYKKYIAGIGLVVTILFSGLFYWLVSDYELSKSKEVDIDISTRVLADIEGNVNAYYTSYGLINIVSRKEDRALQNSLLIQNLDANDQLMLSFDEAISGDVWFASSHVNLLVMRKDNKGFYQINFSNSWRSPSIFKFDSPLPENEKIVGLNYNATVLYLLNDTNFSLSQFDIDNGEQSTPEAFTKLSSTLASLVSLPLSQQSTEFKLNAEQANLSIRIITAPQNQYKALWIEKKISDINNKTMLVLYESFEHENSFDTVTLNDTTLTNLVWDRQGTRLSFVVDKGELFSYQLAQKTLTSWRLGGAKLNNLLADCGRDCFIIARQQGVPKLVNTHLNLYSESNVNHSGYKHAVLTKSDTRPRLETLPFYSDSGLYFVTANEADTHQNGQVFSITKRSPQGVEETVFTFPSNSDVQEFTVNKDESLILGVVNQRPFLIDVKTQSLEFLNLKSPSVQHLRFVNDDLIKFASDRLLQAVANRSNNNSSSNEEIAVYTYNLKNKSINKVASDSFIYESIVLKNASNDEPNRLSGHLRITQNFKAVLTIKEQENARELATIDSNCLRCYQVIDNDFYYIGRQSIDELSYAIFKVNMITGEQKVMPLPETFHTGEFLRQFSINPNTYELALVQRQNLQTDLTQLTGMQQIF